MKKKLLFALLLCILTSTGSYLRAAGIAGAVYTDAKTLTLVGQAEALNSYNRVDLQKYSNLESNIKVLYACGAGLAVSFETNSPYLCVKWKYGARSSNRLYVNRILEKGFDLYIKSDGVWEFAGAGQPESGLETTLVENMDSSVKECLLYLPVYEEITELQIGIAPGSAIAPRPSPFYGKVLIYGNSITQGAAASRPGMAYPARMSRATGVNFVNLGLSGNGFMPKEEADMFADFTGDVYILDCVLNCSVSQIQSRTAYMVNAIRSKHPDAPIIMMAGRVRDRGNFDLARRKHDLDLNTAFEAEYKKLIAAGATKLYYIPSDDFTGRNHDYTTDGSHPTDEGYTLMLSYIQPQLMEIIGKVVHTGTDQTVVPRSASQFNSYFNADSTLYIESNEAFKNISIVDMSGKIMYAAASSGSILAIPAQGWPSGVYVVEASGGNDIYSVKVAKK